MPHLITPNCTFNIINSLWPGDAIQQHRSGSTLVSKVMVSCTKPFPEPMLTYHQRCSVIFYILYILRAISEVLMNLIHNVFGDYTYKTTITSPRANELTLFLQICFLIPCINMISVKLPPYSLQYLSHMSPTSLPLFPLVLSQDQRFTTRAKEQGLTNSFQQGTHWNITRH